jgi:hypothetical protein
MRLPPKLVLAALLLVAAPALAVPPGIYIDDKAIDTTSPTFERDLRKHSKKSIAQENGKWHFHYIVYLNKPAPADQLNLVFYDAKAKGPQEPVAYPINTKAGAKILGGEATCAPEDTIKAGSYIVKVTYLDNGKELVLATAHLDFK